MVPREFLPGFPKIAFFSSYTSLFYFIFLLSSSAIFFFKNSSKFHCKQWHEFIFHLIPFRAHLGRSILGRGGLVSLIQ